MESLVKVFSFYEFDSELPIGRFGFDFIFRLFKVVSLSIYSQYFLVTLSDSIESLIRSLSNLSCSYLSFSYFFIYFLIVSSRLVIIFCCLNLSSFETFNYRYRVIILCSKSMVLLLRSLFSSLKPSNFFYNSSPDFELTDL